MRRFIQPAACFLCLLLVAVAQEFADGARIDSLPVGSTTYHQVQVLSVNARTVMITHRGGMASIPLRDLSPEWQARFHYDPAAETAADQVPRLVAPRPAVATGVKKSTAKSELVLQQFGKPAGIRLEVDLRQRFLQLELGVKSQGRRPSCSIFAVVSALEFLNADSTGRTEKFSEEYLTWAVHQTVQRVAPPGGATEDAAEDADAGFSLSEVVDALRTYGIPLQSTMPNTFGSAISGIETPPPAIVAEARNHQRVFVHRLPGRDNATRINNLVQALNNGVPVPVGMNWPNYRSMRTGYLSGQTPQTNIFHSVTVVGYKCPTGRIEDAVFLFKNSWGVQWGQGGYGTVTYSYLNNHLYDAILLEVQSG